MGKYFKKYLESELYSMYEQTYSDSNYENFWTAIFTSCELFRTLAMQVSNHFGYSYNKQEDENMMKYLKWVRGVEN